MIINRLAIIGLGSIGRRHLRLVSEIRPDIEIILVRSGYGSECEEEKIASKTVNSISEAIKYKIQAIDLSGRFETYPIAGYFSFNAVGGIPVQNGDINMDESINVLDIVLAVNYVLGVEDLSSYQIQIADMNSDQIVNILDIILIVNIILGN